MPARLHRLAYSWLCVAAVTGALGCSPALNWREVRMPESELVALFPCRPDQLMRPVMLAGSRTPMRLSSCSADSMTFAVSYATLAEPRQVTGALAQLRTAAGDNIGGQAADPRAMTIAGMTPHPLAQRWALQGRGADGTAVVERVGFFTKGLTVYQATVVGARLQSEAVETFFSGMKLR